MEKLLEQPIVKKLAAAEECVWINPALADAKTALAAIPYGKADVKDAADRLLRFAPYNREVKGEYVTRVYSWEDVECIIRQFKEI